VNCLIFGYGYMGQIRYRILKEHPMVNSVRVVDPGLSAVPAGMEADWIRPGDEIPWDAVDAAFVCTPNDVTASLTAEALKRCGRVFCEKPPGRNWEDLQIIRKAVSEIPGHTLVFGFNHRLHPSIQVAQALVGEGGLGEILYVKGTYGKSGGVRYRQSWRNQLEVSGGGILLDQGIHMLDLFGLFLGPLKVVEAVLSDSFWKCGVEDNALVLMRSAQGIPAFLHSSATLWKHTFELQLGCQNGYLIARGLLSKSGSYGREQLVIGRRQFEDEAMALGNPKEELITFDRDDSWKAEVDEFIAAVSENRPATHGTLEEALAVMEVIRDAYATTQEPSWKGEQR